MLSIARFTATSGSALLVRKRVLITALSSRGVRDFKKIFRSKPPRFRINLQALPPLTALLTKPELNQPNLNGDAINLRLEKLEVYKKYLPTNSTTTLLEAIFHPNNDIDGLLQVVDENLVTMTSFYIGVSVEAIDDMIRAGLCDKATVACSPEFKRLCEKALYKLRFFESDEILKLIKCLANLQMPEDLMLVQAALQMARHLINDFSHEELTALSSSLERLEPIQSREKSLLIALKNAIPVAQEKLINSNQVNQLEPPQQPDRSQENRFTRLSHGRDTPTRSRDKIVT